MNGLGVRSTGKSTVYLKRTKEKYLIKFPDNELKNIIKGNLYIFHVGNLIVREENSGVEVVINFP
jgi:hypothetical protein